MKYRNKINKNLGKRFENINRILLLSRATYRPETFHELRLDIKKVNAIFDLINYCEKDFKRKKAFKSFKVIFKKAGAIRELYVEESLLKKYNVPYSARHTKEIQQNLRDRKAEFFKTIDIELIHGLKKGIGKADEALSGLKNRFIEEYFKEVVQRIEHMLKQQLNESQLHRLRGHLKIFYYNIKGINFEKQNIIFKELDIRQKLLGQWHDCTVVVENISKSLSKNEMDSLEVKQLKAVRTKLILQSRKLLKRINKRASIEIFHAQ